MAFVLKDRVKETSTTTGTGTITLGGASAGYQGFSTVGNANTTFYSIGMGTEWENGVGTYTSSGSTLSRDTVLSSSNSGSLVNFSAGTKDVFITYPAGRAASYDTPSQSTGSFIFPVGTTAQRPSSPAVGMIRYNTTESDYEVYDGTNWVIIDTSPIPYTVEYLVVAGGGGGSAYGAAGGGGGGGGAGGYLASSISVNSGTVYTVTVGAGGNAGANTINGSNGANSVFGAVTATGGGGGDGYQNNGSSGGSGGGGSYSGLGGAGTSGQGFAGGNGATWTGGGGGGAGAVGSAGTTQASGGNGGVGLNWQSLGTFYAGGGGGGAYVASSGSAGAGGNGGGASGTLGGGTPSNATANRGGGGGGGGGASGSNGGSGIVIIRYAGTQRGTGGTISSSGGYTYHTFTSSGTYTA